MHITSCWCSYNSNQNKKLSLKMTARRIWRPLVGESYKYNRLLLHPIILKAVLPISGFLVFINGDLFKSVGIGLPYVQQS